MPSGDEERLDPAVLNTALMYKIVKRLGNIEKILSDQVPLGKIYNIPNGIVVTGDTYVYFVYGSIVLSNGTKTSIPTFGRPLFAIAIENEGLNDCKIVINPDEAWGSRTINKGETFNVDLKRSVIKEVKLSVTPGESCTIQISGVV